MSGQPICGPALLQAIISIIFSEFRNDAFLESRFKAVGASRVARSCPRLMPLGFGRLHPGGMKRE
jgi:hypothetical protein